MLVRDIVTTAEEQEVIILRQHWVYFKVIRRLQDFFKWDASQLQDLYTDKRVVRSPCNRVRQLYKNITMLFLFPVKDGKLSTGVNATFDASCYC